MLGDERHVAATYIMGQKIEENTFIEKVNEN
jgi:hypothetical protein